MVFIIIDLELGVKKEQCNMREYQRQHHCFCIHVFFFLNIVDFWCLYCRLQHFAGQQESQQYPGRRFRGSHGSKLPVSPLSVLTFLLFLSNCCNFNIFYKRNHFFFNHERSCTTDTSSKLGRCALCGQQLQRSRLRPTGETKELKTAAGAL